MMYRLYKTVPVEGYDNTKTMEMVARFETLHDAMTGVKVGVWSKIGDNYWHSGDSMYHIYTEWKDDVNREEGSSEDGTSTGAEHGG